MQRTPTGDRNHDPVSIACEALRPHTIARFDELLQRPDAPTRLATVLPSLKAASTLLRDGTAVLKPPDDRITLRSIATQACRIDDGPEYLPVRADGWMPAFLTDVDSREMEHDPTRKEIEHDATPKEHDPTPREVEHDPTPREVEHDPTRKYDAGYPLVLPLRTLRRLPASEQAATPVPTTFTRSWIPLGWRSAPDDAEIYTVNVLIALAGVVGPQGRTTLLDIVADSMPSATPDEIDSLGRRRTPILPFGLLPEAPRTTFVHVQNGHTDLTAAPGPRNPELPLLSLCREEAQTAPFLRLVDAAGISALKPGRGARMDKRMLFYALASLPLAYRQSGSRYTHQRPLRWWIQVLYKDPANYRPSRAERQIRAGMRGLVDATVGLKGGGEWIPVVPRMYPDFRDLDSELQLEIALPDACGHGAAVPWKRLVAAGTESDPAFDLQISLAYLWDKAKALNGGYRVYATRPRARRNHAGALLNRDGTVITARAGAPREHRHGRLTWPGGTTPVTDWRHPDAVIEGTERNPRADLVPPMSREEIRRLAYPSTAPITNTQQRNQRARAVELITELERCGQITVEHLSQDRRRILENAPEAANDD